MIAGYHQAAMWEIPKPLVEVFDRRQALAEHREVAGEDQEIPGWYFDFAMKFMGVAQNYQIHRSTVDALLVPPDSFTRQNGQRRSVTRSQLPI